MLVDIYVKLAYKHKFTSLNLMMTVYYFKSKGGSIHYFK